MARLSTTMRTGRKEHQTPSKFIGPGRTRIFKGRLYKPEFADYIAKGIVEILYAQQ